jgi:predicted SAM-dependent methyltransferase
MKSEKTKKYHWLYLGCGHDRMKGFTHIEVNAGKNKSGLPDIIADITGRIPLPDGSCELIFSRATMEHLSYPELLNCLLESHRLLRRGGVVRMVVPDLEKYVEDYQNKVYDPKLRELYGMPNDNYEETFVARIMYFDHRYNHTVGTMRRALEKAGFENVKRVLPGDTKITGAQDELQKAEQNRDLEFIIEAEKLDKSPTLSHTQKKYLGGFLGKILANWFNIKISPYFVRRPVFPRRYWFIEKVTLFKQWFRGDSGPRN